MRKIILIMFLWFRFILFAQAKDSCIVKGIVKNANDSSSISLIVESKRVDVSAFTNSDFRLAAKLNELGVEYLGYKSAGGTLVKLIPIFLK